MRTSPTAVCIGGLLFALCFSAGCRAQSAPKVAPEEAYELLRAGRYEEARPLFRALLDAPGDSASHFALPWGRTFEAVGHYEQGLDAAQALLVESEGEDPYVLHARGRLLAATGRYGEAEAAFREARRQKQDFWPNEQALGELLMRTGRPGEANRLFARIYDRYRNNALRTAEALGSAGQAAARLGHFRAANDAFRTAHRLDSANVEVLHRWGDLFREKYNDADARQTYEQALAINPRHAGVLVSLARSVGDPRKKEALVRRALEVNPRHVGALSLLAKLHLDNGQYDEAEPFLRQALAVNVSSVPALAHLASVHHLRGEQAAFEQTAERARAVDPQSSAFFVTVAEDVSRRFRYPDALRFSRQAVSEGRADPTSLAMLGTNLLRAGRAQEARLYLQASFDRDPFNLFVGNTLTMIDEYAQFDTLETEHVRLLVHASERDVVGPAALAVAQAAYDSLSARYPYVPLGKIQVEMYHDEDDFAVRVAGVPHLGLLGVSFGDVVALRTPQAGSGAPQNWARTLWHEVAHTMALGVSNYHVPRWFTEGLSVYEEQRARPAWGRELELQLLAALAQGKLLPLEDIGEGFSRPSFRGQVILSYYHAGRVIAFIAEQHGFAVVTEMLEAFAQGESFATAAQRALGQSVDELDDAFRAHLRQRRQALAPALGDAPVALGDSSQATAAADTSATQTPQLDRRAARPFFERLQAGQAALDSEQYDEAAAAFEEALRLYPNYVGPGSAYQGLMAVHRARREDDALRKVLERFLDVSEHGAEEARELAALHEQAGRERAAIRFLERSLHVAPHDRETHARLATLHEQLGEPAQAATARRAVLALGPVDEAEAYFKLAQNLYDSRQFAEAKRATLQALERAPGYRAAQALLLRCVERDT